MAVFQDFLVVTGCVKCEYHRRTRVLVCIPEKRRIYRGADRAVLLFPDGDYAQAGSWLPELPWRLPPVARDDWN